MPIQKNRYLSVLKLKAGEVEAVRHLAANVWEHWNPLFELLPVEPDPGQTLDELVGDTLYGLIRACTSGATVFIDFEEAEVNQTQFVERVLEKLVTEGLVPVPVIQPDSAQTIVDGVRNFLTQHNNGIALRLDFGQLLPNITQRVQTLVADVGARINESHLLLDMEEIDEAIVPQIMVTMPNLLGLVPALRDWASFTLVGASIPRILGVPSATNAVLSRVEWDLFNQLSPFIRPLVSRLDFGDYAICNPELVEFDPRRMQIAPKIIYTIPNAWIVYKGRSIRRLNWEQTRAMCRDLIGRSEYCGRNYSYGDEYIDDCANGQVSAGNSMIWKRVGTNHHITFVANQVSNLP